MRVGDPLHQDHALMNEAHTDTTSAAIGSTTSCSNSCDLSNIRSPQHSIDDINEEAFVTIKYNYEAGKKPLTISRIYRRGQSTSTVFKLYSYSCTMVLR